MMMLILRIAGSSVFEQAQWMCFRTLWVTVTYLLANQRRFCNVYDPAMLMVDFCCLRC